MAKRKVIITVAPTGGMASKQQNPHLPTQPDEIAADVIQCYNAGASVVALHARRPDDGATCDAAIYRRMNEAIRAQCDIIINNSTGGGVSGDMIKQIDDGFWEIDFEQRLKGLDAGAEMCTLDSHTIIASFGGKELLLNTAPSRCLELAKRMKEKGIKPEWEVFNPAHILQDMSTLIAAGFDWEATSASDWKTICTTGMASCRPMSRRSSVSCASSANWTWNLRHQPKHVS